MAFYWLHASQPLDTAEPQTQRAAQLEIHLFKEKTVLLELADLRQGSFFKVPEGFIKVTKSTDTVNKMHREDLSQVIWLIHVSYNNGGDHY